jgi:hypothetical protein
MIRPKVAAWLAFAGCLASLAAFVVVANGLAAAGIRASDTGGNGSDPMGWLAFFGSFGLAAILLLVGLQMLSEPIRRKT